MEKRKPMLSRALVAFLFALGLLLPLLGALDLLAHALPCAALLLGICAVMAAVSLNKRATLALWAAVIVGLLLWVTALGGMLTLREILTAVGLRLAGIHGALPLVAVPCALLLTVFLTLLCWLIASPDAGVYPSLAALCAIFMALWLADRADLMPFVLPAVIALIVHYIRTSHGGMPLRRNLPIAAIAAALSLLLTPSGGVTSPPLEKFAKDLRQQIFDHLFFTEPRNVFSLANEGYYPQGASQLGGKATPTDHPVMQVRTPRRVLLRGTVMDEYTGRMWRNTTGGRRYLFVSPRWSGLKKTLFDMELPHGRAINDSSLLKEQTIAVRMLAPNTSTLFLPQRLRELETKGDLVTYFNNGSEVFVTRDLAGGDTYSVTAPLMTAGDAGLGTLISACANDADPHYAQTAELYLKLPAHLQPQVYDLAAQIVRDASTPYEKAFALQNYLSRNYRYTLDTEPQDSSYDFVTNFLFTAKEGYCTYFASAMTVLCRMVGLPARYVEGYQAIPDENGLAYVTGLQGHAWTEVYFSGFGWLTFDATPPQGRTAPPSQEPDGSEAPPRDEPTPTPEPETPPDSPTPEPDPEDPLPEDEPTPEPTPPPEAPETDPPSLAWLWILLLVLLLAAASARIWLTQPARQADRIGEPAAAFHTWVQAVFDLTTLCGLPMSAAESPMAYGHRVDALHALPAALTPLCETLSLVLYGKVVPEPEEIALARQTFQALYAPLTPLQTARFALLRAFVPLRKRDFTQRK